MGGFVSCLFFHYFCDHRLLECGESDRWARWACGRVFGDGVDSCSDSFRFLPNHIDFARYLNILYIEGSGEIAVYLFALAGASLGFFWYNGYPAQVFMGDTGSLLSGGSWRLSGALRREVILAIAGAIFVAEALSVILQVLSYRYRNKKRIFLFAPLHHHFEYKGWPETKVVIRFWIVSLLFANLAIATLKLQ